MVGGAPGPGAPLLVWGLRQLHGRVETLVGDLTEKQLAWSPARGAHSLGFTLWHIPRCDDNYLRQHIQGRTEVWQEGRGVVPALGSGRAEHGDAPLR